MRGGGRVVSTVMAGALLLVAVPATLPPSHAAAGTVDSLRARRAQLAAQMAQLAPARNDASRALVTAQTQLSAVQDQILSTQRDLGRQNQRLSSLSGQIAADGKVSQHAKHELAGMTRAAYEASSDNAFMNSLLSASSVGDAVDRLKAEQHVSDKVDQLVRSITEKDRAVVAERNDLRTAVARSAAMEDQLGTQDTQLLGLVAARNAAYASASGPVQALAREIHDLDQQIAAATQGASESLGSAIGGGTCGNHFAYGQCTYYVATRRCIPWSGNARDWWNNAAAAGFAEGHTPEVGAVVTFYPGGQGASWAGHVGYVETVGPSGGVPAGEFRFSEMNFGGWNRVSYRTLPNNAPGIQGFIYGRR